MLKSNENNANSTAPLRFWLPDAQASGEVAARSLRLFLRSKNMDSIDYEPSQTGPILALAESAKGLERIFFLLENQSLAEQKLLVLWHSEDVPLSYEITCRLLAAGATDVLRWEKDDARAGARLQGCLARLREIEHWLASPKITEKYKGSAPVWRRALARLVECARFSQANLLVLGESGTGKEQAAALVHELDPRPHKDDLVLLDCSAISPELSGSEFFGHEKGAFTNAISNRDGAFCLAHLGTLFLDEVGELTLPLQAELLRAVQEKRYKRVGSNVWQKTDFRLVCATNRDLQAEVASHGFRQDLFYRIAGTVVLLPPLRERRSDIPELARHFLADALRNVPLPAFDPHLTTWLLTRDYPGNLRELRQLMCRLAARYPGGGLLTLGDVPASDLPPLSKICQPLEQSEVRNALRIALENGLGLKEIKHQLSDLTMHLAVELANGNLQQAAGLLQVSDRLVQGWRAEARA